MLEPDLLAHLGVLVDRERQRRRLRQHGEPGGGDLDRAGRQLGVLVALGPGHDLARDLHAELRPQPVRPLGHLTLAEHHLRGAGRVAQVDEDHAAVIATPRHPPGEGHGLSGVLGTEGACEVAAHHGSEVIGAPRAAREQVSPGSTGAASLGGQRGPAVPGRLGFISAASPRRGDRRTAPHRTAPGDGRGLRGVRVAQSRASCSASGDGSVGIGGAARTVGSEPRSRPWRRSSGATRVASARRYSGVTYAPRR